LLEVEVIGSALPEIRVREAVAYAAASAGIADGHVAVAFVDPQRIARLNTEHRGVAGPPDVLSFPVDGDAPAEDLVEAVVHGVLHLTGMDHEHDDGEMLALQAEIRAWMR
jgi:probable rRNA maturation factor